RLGPYAPPNAGRARVPDAGAPALLPLRLTERVVGGIEDLDAQLVLAARAQPAGVEREVRIAALVHAEETAVERHPRTPVDGAEVEIRVPVPLVRYPERSAVAQPLVHLVARADPRERRLERERHEDLAPCVAGLELHLPCAVEAHREANRVEPVRNLFTLDRTPNLYPETAVGPLLSRLRGGSSDAQGSLRGRRGRAARRRLCGVRADRGRRDHEERIQRARRRGSERRLRQLEELRLDDAPGRGRQNELQAQS